MIDFSIMGKEVNIKIIELTRIIVAYRPISAIGGSLRYPGDRARIACSTNDGSVMIIKFSDGYEALVSSQDVREIQL